MPGSLVTQTVGSQPVGDGLVALSSPGTEIDGRFELREVVGSGGYAVVYRAYDRLLRREVALKVLRPDRQTASAVERLRRELVVARDAQSPHLVRMFEIAQTGEEAYLTMELVRGESLASRLSRGRLAVDEAVRVAAEVARGLGALHALGVVHRDVKPGNILLARGGAKLGDFGLARELADETRQSRTGEVVGTLDYIAPEQALGAELDARTDLYALGVVLFEMLTGQIPHRRATSLASLMARLGEEGPASVSRLRPEAPPWLDGVVRRLLERDPARRYPSCEALGRDLVSGEARDRGTRRWRALAMVGGLTLLAAGGHARKRESSAVQLIPSGTGGLTARDASGHTLWALPAAMPHRTALVRLAPGAEPRVATIVGRSEEVDFEAVHRLAFLDLRTGRPVRTVTLPDRASVFPQFSRTYAPRLRSYDLDGDRVDELVVTYEHLPYWPSYSVLYEPRLDRARVILAASGHHRPLGAEDLDRDGTRELLFAGPSNRMGWYTGVAALKLVPAVGETGSPLAPAVTPDRPGPPGSLDLLWYKLLPLSLSLQDTTLMANPLSGRLLLRAAGGALHRLGFHGFEPPKPLDAERHREEARRRCYELLREAGALRGDPAAAAALRTARQLAEAAGDPVLVEWVGRNEVGSLIAAGRHSEADAMLAELTRSPVSTSIELDAGRAFHAAGEPARALSWYRRGAAAQREARISRAADCLAGLIAAQVELRQWTTLIAELDEARARPSGWGSAIEVARQYARWRGGLPIDREAVERFSSGGDPDVVRYWRLELGLATGAGPGKLLEDVDAALPTVSVAQPLFLALRAEALGRLGRLEEAVGTARQAIELGDASLPANLDVRAHLDVVLARHEVLAARTGRETEARMARARLHQLERQRAAQLAQLRLPEAAPR